MKVSVIIVTYNHRKYIGQCLESVIEQKPYEVVVVDNGSDGTAEYVIRNFPSVKVIKPEKNLGYAGGNNLGVRHARGEYIVILNPDTVVEKGWLEELVKPLEKRQADYGIERLGYCLIILLVERITGGESFYNRFQRNSCQVRWI